MENIIANNRKALHDYFIHQKFECGIILTGTEIKAIRQNKVDIKQAYVQIKEGKVLIIGMHIGLFDMGNQFNHDPFRTRELLLHRSEIIKLEKQVSQKGYTLVPLRLYYVRGRVKVEIALSLGKKNYDKRESIKERDLKREMEKQYKLR